jgi:hypothetical protein
VAASEKPAPEKSPIGEKSPGNEPEMKPLAKIQKPLESISKERLTKIREASATETGEKPPRVFPNTYWSRKGGGWVLEFKKKIKGEWLYEYYGLLKLETWQQLKERYQDEKLEGIIKGVILAKRSELQRARNSRPGNHRLRLVGQRR